MLKVGEGRSRIIELQNLNLTNSKICGMLYTEREERDRIMKVWYISEECHGFIGLASTLEKAMKFLIEEGWINEGTVDDRGLSMEHYFGIHWREAVLKSFTVGDLEAFGFHLRKVDVYD